MHGAKLWPSHGDHLRCCVKFHGAGAKRNHCLIQRQILALQQTHITHHFGFRTMPMKYGMGQEFGLAFKIERNTARVSHRLCTKNAEYLLQRFMGRRFIQRDANMIFINLA